MQVLRLDSSALFKAIATVVEFLKVAIRRQVARMHRVWYSEALESDFTFR